MYVPVHTNRDLASPNITSVSRLMISQLKHLSFIHACILLYERIYGDQYKK